jgi:methionyl-tRNA formyltransferase
MIKDFDAGPVYLKKDLSIEGNAEEIYIRATYLSFSMIQKIIDQSIEPTPQTGKPVVFKRRNPQESRISQFINLQSLYDFIRMLDADGYPKAFLEINGFRYEFSRAGFYNDRIVADVIITPIAKEDK